MKRLRLALALLAALALGLTPQSKVLAQSGPITTNQCNQTTFQAASAASLQTLVAGVAGKTVSICGWHVTSNSGTASTFQFSYGTGANCGTTNNPFTPAFSVTNTAPSADHLQYITSSAPQGSNLCVVSSNTSLQIMVWYGIY